jgi:hypothetical protein
MSESESSFGLTFRRTNENKAQAMVLLSWFRLGKAGRIWLSGQSSGIIGHLRYDSISGREFLAREF